MSGEFRPIKKNVSLFKFSLRKKSFGAEEPKAPSDEGAVAVGD